MLARRLALSLVATSTIAAVLAACGDEPSAPLDAPVADAPPPDAGLPASCTGACRTLALAATFGATTRAFEHAVYGVTAGPTPSLHVEAFRGGAAGCPTERSPTPDYTLVLGAVPVPTSTAPVTSSANLLDFVGDLLNGPLGAAATTVAITPVAADVCATCVGQPAPSHAAGFVALDLQLTFAAGTVTGHLFATHCDELDAPGP